MPNRIRRFSTALATASLVFALAHPALAMERSYDIGDEPSSVPMIFDVLVMRPIGLLMTGLGCVVYVVPVAPIMAITRPADIAKPLGPLVGAPARFTFKDPIGQHP
jgi:hypothetical protein